MSLKQRVVVTGLGIASPNGITVDTVHKAFVEGNSGIRHIPQLEDLDFRCQIAGQPLIPDNYISRYLNPIQSRGLIASGLTYGIIAGMDAWKDSGLAQAKSDVLPLWNTGVIFGAGVSGVDKFREAIYKVDAKNVRRLGSTVVIQTMTSGISAYLGGLIGAGNWVTTNSSACGTGTESVRMGYERIALGQADVILCGSSGDSGPYIWGGFDAMRILPTAYNDNPGDASRPLSASASGFVPGSGAGALVLESLDHALERNATIYAEILGGTSTSGGQRNGGSMTASNSEAVIRCIKKTIEVCGLQPEEIDLINGHLTATTRDPVEIDNWCQALSRYGKDFPLINSSKSLIGHCLSASGSIECVLSVLQLYHQIVYGNRNCEDLHPKIENQIDRECVPQKARLHSFRTLLKASFGFGDINTCLGFRVFD